MKKLNTHDDSMESWETGILMVITIVAVFFVAFFTLIIVQIDKQIVRMAIQMDKVEQRYDDLVYENEILWTYVENIDTCTSIEDAIQKRDDIYDLVQFIGE